MTILHIHMNFLIMIERAELYAELSKIKVLREI